MSKQVAALISEAFGIDSPVQVIARGSVAGPDDAVVRLVFHSDDALAHMARSPGELGLARAYISGSLDIEGDLFALLRVRASGETVRLGLRDRTAFLAAVGLQPWRRAPVRPAEEIDIGGRIGRHGLRRDRRAIAHHYDVGNEFYERLLGPTMIYSCAVFNCWEDSLETAQHNKLNLICRKLALEADHHLLDVGCGWGSLLIHAAHHYGTRGTGITLSERQATYARRRVAELGLEDRIEIRVCDYRQLGAERFDAISSVGMVEHVGRARLEEYLDILCDLLVEGGRLLNHQIGIGPEKTRRRGTRSSKVHTNSFVHRYVFPDGELHDVGEIIALMQQSSLEVRHVESLREHYAITTRRWLANLDEHWSEMVRLAGEPRCRVWRLYLAGAAVNFELGPAQVHQILAVRTPIAGREARPQRHAAAAGFRARSAGRDHDGLVDSRCLTPRQVALVANSSFQASGDAGGRTVEMSPTTTYDLHIKGGTIVDGTRVPRYRGDLWIKDGRIAQIGGRANGVSDKVIDADGLIVAPGFVDLHTHYDAQIRWDPWCTISGWHGVTSVVLGNCGFGFAPVQAGVQGTLDADHGAHRGHPLPVHGGGHVAQVGLGDHPGVPRLAGPRAARGELHPVHADRVADDLRHGSRSGQDPPGDAPGTQGDAAPVA